MNKTLAFPSAKNPETEALEKQDCMSHLTDQVLHLSATRHPIHVAASLYALTGTQIEKATSTDLKALIEVLQIILDRSRSDNPRHCSYNLGSDRGYVYGQGNFRRIILRKLSGTALWVVTDDTNKPSHSAAGYATQSALSLAKVLKSEIATQEDCIRLKEPHLLSPAPAPNPAPPRQKIQPRESGDITPKPGRKSPSDEAFQAYFLAKLEAHPILKTLEEEKSFFTGLMNKLGVPDFKITTKIVSKDKSYLDYLETAWLAFRKAALTHLTHQQHERMKGEVLDLCYMGNSLVRETENGLTLNPDAFKSEGFCYWFECFSGVPEQLSAAGKSPQFPKPIKLVLTDMEALYERRKTTEATELQKMLKDQKHEELFAELVQSGPLSSKDVHSFLTQIATLDAEAPQKKKLYQQVCSKLPADHSIDLSANEIKTLLDSLCTETKSKEILPEFQKQALQLLLATHSLGNLKRWQVEKILKAQDLDQLNKEIISNLTQFILGEFLLQFSNRERRETYNAKLVDSFFENTLSKELFWALISPSLREGSFSLRLCPAVIELVFKMHGSIPKQPATPKCLLCPMPPETSSEMQRLLVDILSLSPHPSQHRASSIDIEIIPDPLQYGHRDFFTGFIGHPYEQQLIRLLSCTGVSEELEALLKLRTRITGQVLRTAHLSVRTCLSASIKSTQPVQTSPNTTCHQVFTLDELLAASLPSEFSIPAPKLAEQLPNMAVVSAHSEQDRTLYLTHTSLRNVYTLDPGIHPDKDLAVTTIIIKGDLHTQRQVDGDLSAFFREFLSKPLSQEEKKKELGLFCHARLLHIAQQIWLAIFPDDKTLREQAISNTLYVVTCGHVFQIDRKADQKRSDFLVNLSILREMLQASPLHSVKKGYFQRSILPLIQDLMSQTPSQIDPDLLATQVREALYEELNFLGIIAMVRHLPLAVEFALRMTEIATQDYSIGEKFLAQLECFHAEMEVSIAYSIDNRAALIEAFAKFLLGYREFLAKNQITPQEKTVIDETMNTLPEAFRSLLTTKVVQ